MTPAALTVEADDNTKFPVCHRLAAFHGEDGFVPSRVERLHVVVL